jgi:beta-mannosidase
MKIISCIFFFLASIPVCAQHGKKEPYQKEITNWEFRMAGDSTWKPARVPGTIMDNFVDLKDVSNPLHPYYGDNEKLYQWIGDKDWEFRTSLQIDSLLLAQGYTYNLEFGCLDLFADIWLNDMMWNQANAFMPFTLENLTEPQVDIRILFHSTTQTVKKLMEVDSLKLPGGPRVYARTPQYQFGWDWGPTFVNMGIRKPVTLSLQPPKYAEIYELSYAPWKIETKKGSVGVMLHGATNCDSLEWHLKVYLNGDSIDGFDGKYHTHLEDAYLYHIQKPQLWWPNGSGKKSNYYEFDIRMNVPGDTLTLAHKHFYYAACDIQLIQEKDKYGQSFYFKVNGKPIYAKGANYVPDDSFHPGEKTTELVNLAAEANMNMLRVWGGGTYPNNDFYITCLKKGIMVWQDFMFACAMYPGSHEFYMNLTEEAVFQADRLRAYNNIALWCGNNENDEGWKNWGWQKECNISTTDSIIIWKNYLTLFQDLLPGALIQDYHNRKNHADYVTTSPKHGWGRKESMTDDDSHYWGVWWGLEPIKKYEEKIPRFMSEFGMQAMPDLSTLKKVIPDSAMHFDSPLFKNHQKHPTGFKTLNHYLKEYLAVPENMEDYAYATQVLQAYALTTAIEAQRRAMPYCMGTLLWQLNDCWPVTSWSLIDSELKTKIAYEEVKKAYAPTTISVKEEKDNYSIYIINEDEKINHSFLQILLLDFYGNIKFKKKIFIGKPALSSKLYFKLSKKIVEKFDPTSVYLDLLLMKKDNSQNQTRLITCTSKQFHFVEPNQLRLPPSAIRIEKDEDTYWIKSDTYCPFVFIPQEGEEEDVYLGTIGPRNQLGFAVSSNNGTIAWIEKLMQDPTKIKCLNNLLAK